MNEASIDWSPNSTTLLVILETDSLDDACGRSARALKSVAKPEVLNDTELILFRPSAKI